MQFLRCYLYIGRCYLYIIEEVERRKGVYAVCFLLCLVVVSFWCVLCTVSGVLCLLMVF